MNAGQGSSADGSSADGSSGASSIDSRLGSSADGSSGTSSIEELMTCLVHEAPEMNAAVVDDLLTKLRSVRHPLAHSIARVLELVAEHLVDPGIALPALAMACATLCDRRSDDKTLEASRYEIETLLPVADPVIPVSSLKRR